MTTGVLQARGLCKAYKQNQVLKNLDITIEPGKIYGLIGRNGAGKTTLLGILTAQNTHDSGEVTYNGEPVWENPRALEDLCFSRELQTTLFYGQNSLKVRHYLQAGATFYSRWDEEYARRLLKEFGVEEKKRVSQLSKGQLSMVTILIALASNAPITILDEPVAGLDVVARERFYQLLLEDYARTGRTFIISTHIIEEAASVFERVLILDGGRIIEDEETEELVRQGINPISFKGLKLSITSDESKNINFDEINNAIAQNNVVSGKITGRMHGCSRTAAFPKK